MTDTSQAELPFDIEAGKNINIKIFFNSTKEGKFKEDIVFNSSAGSSIDSIMHLELTAIQIYSISGRVLNNGVGMDKPFHILASKYLPHLQLTPNGQYVPLYRYENGVKVENITDWDLELFRSH